MSTSIDFIKQYGGKTFDELPFCDIDNIALCEIFYMPFEKVIYDRYDREPISFKEACDKLFAYNGFKHVAPGLVLPKSISVKMMAMADSKRYADVKMVACQSVFNFNPAIQFAAVTLILPDGTLVVVYRGTDDTFVGWKEDFDIYTRVVVPSHKLGVQYLEKIAKTYKGDIIICGHSKGGNIGLYSVLNCNKTTRKRIARLYNNDGPGFHDYRYLNLPAYKEILPKYRHFVPSNSMIGMLMAHDDDYQIVKSTHFLGMIQHAPFTWKTNGTSFATKEDLFLMAKIADIGLRKMIFSLSDKQSEVFDEVMETIVEGVGQINLTNFSRNIGSSVKGMVSAFRGLDEDTRKVWRSNFEGAGKIFSDAFSSLREKDTSNRDAAERAAAVAAEA